MGLLESSVKGVFQTFMDTKLYPEDIDKIVQVGYSLISNHCFVDGNKRIGIMLLLYLLDINEISHNIGNDNATRLGLAVASGKMNRDELKKEILNSINR